MDVSLVNRGDAAAATWIFRRDRYVFRYFNCIKLDARGDDPSKIKVLMADMSINCRSTRYRQTRIFTWVMVLVYPIGVPLFCFAVLFLYRREINPKVDAC